MSGAIVRAAQRLNANLLSPSVTGLRQKALAANTNLMPITGKEVLNSFMASGLSRAAGGAAVGAAWGAVSGGSAWEGAKTGAVIGGAYGTASDMSRNRAALMKSAFGVDAGRGLMSGFRATSMAQEIAGEGRGAVRKAISSAGRASYSASLDYARSRQGMAQALRSIRSGGPASGAEAAVSAFQEAGATYSTFAPSIRSQASIAAGIGRSTARLAAMAERAAR